MKDFTGSLQFIVFFLVMVVIITMTLGEKVATAFLWLVLAGMVLTNADKMVKLMDRFSGFKPEKATQDLGNGVYIA